MGEVYLQVSESIKGIISAGDRYGWYMSLYNSPSVNHQHASHATWPPKYTYIQYVITGEIGSSSEKFKGENTQGRQTCTSTLGHKRGNLSFCNDRKKKKLLCTPSPHRKTWGRECKLLVSLMKINNTQQ